MTRLIRQVILPQLRGGRRTLAVVSLALGAVCGSWLALPKAPALAVVIPAPVASPFVYLPQAPVVVVAPIPMAPKLASPCPEPNRNGSEHSIARLPEALLANTTYDDIWLAVSPTDVRRMVVWNRNRVYVSFDEGRSFQRIATGNQRIIDAAFDCRGQLHLLNVDRRLGTLEPEQRAITRWERFAAPNLDPLMFLPDGDGIALISFKRQTDLLFITHKEGTRWRNERLRDDGGCGPLWEFTITNQVWLPKDRLMIWASASDCDYYQPMQLVFDAPNRRVNFLTCSNIPDAPAYSEAFHDVGSRTFQRDAANRWIGQDVSDPLLLLRMTDAEMQTYAAAP